RRRMSSILASGTTARAGPALDDATYAEAARSPKIEIFSGKKPQAARPRFARRSPRDVAGWSMVASRRGGRCRTTPMGAAVSSLERRVAQMIWPNSRAPDLWRASAPRALRPHCLAGHVGLEVRRETGKE